MILLMVAAMQVSTSFDPNLLYDMEVHKKPIVTYFVGDTTLKNQWTNQIRSNAGVVYDDIHTAIKTLSLLNYYYNKE